ncbi:MAG TPA: hypothetical protein VFC78_14330 [Tepidisphaeraceae bacterium]|nr:hypothetical protein [Tepidisphaeraceae bacterium]
MFAIWALLACAADRLFHLPGALRVGLLAAGGIGALCFFLRPMRLLFHPVDWVETAATIERQNPAFGQRLVTVTSRMLGSAAHRGSDEILSHLLREVGIEADVQRRRRLLSLRCIAGPWVGLLATLAVAVALLQLPRLGGAALLHRFFSPLADIPPVTTTQLTVSPGDADVLQSDPLKLQVEARRLGGGAVWLFLNDDASNWSRYAMDDAGDGRFTYTLTSVARDFHYYASGGDAVSPRFTIRVKRPLSVAQFRIRYTYPAYTGRAPLTVTNTDGSIEAPVGTQALLTITATEPLQSALLTVGARKVLMEKTDRDNVRQADLRIEKDATYELDLISTREVHGAGLGRMLIRAIPDHPPLVRLLQAGQSLCLNPRDLLPLSYIALDDFGLETLTVRAQVNAAPAINMPLALEGDRRRQKRTVDFDLASLKLGIGDVLTLSLAARDTAGQETRSEDLVVLISPHEVDTNANERIGGLEAAVQFAQSLAGNLDTASKSIEDANGPKDRAVSQYNSALSRASRTLSAAFESATLLRQSLLRVEAHSGSPEMARALAGWVDGAQQQYFVADDLFRRAGTPAGVDGPARQRLRHALDQSREMEGQLKTVWQGERAAAVLADRENVDLTSRKPAPADPKTAQRRAKTLQRTKQDIDAGAVEIGLNASSGDLEAQLRAKISAAAALERSRAPVDFAAAARGWSQELHRDPHQKTDFDSRLSAAAQAQAVRPDSDLVYAQDLGLAARAAGALEAAIGEPGSKIAPYEAKLNRFPGILEAMAREHAVRRRGPDAHGDELKLTAAEANKAREELARWGAQRSPGRQMIASLSAAARQAEMEDLALRASADTARRDYKKAADDDAAFDRELAAAVRNPGRAAETRTADNGSPAVAQAIEDRVGRIQRAGQAISRHVASAQAMDQLGQTQEKLARETHGGPGAKPGDLASRQRGVAEQIARVERQESAGILGAGTNGSAAGASSADAASADVNDPNWRGRATAALLFAQEQLAAMPQDLAGAQEAAGVRRRAAERADSAHREVSAASVDMRPMAQRAASQADQDLADAADRLEKMIAPVAPAVAMDLADRLEPFAPEASGARDLVAGPLAGALKSLGEAAKGGDANAIAQAAAQARQTIDAVQKELVVAQDAFTQRDPLVAAKWFARTAADALVVHPGDVRQAMSHQAHAALALSRAWNRSIHQAAALRLSALPALQGIYAPRDPQTATASSAAVLSPDLAAVRDWGKLHARDTQDLSAGLREPDPPGYEEPLRLYFQALGNAQGKTK